MKHKEVPIMIYNIIYYYRVRIPGLYTATYIPRYKYFVGYP